MTFLLGLGLLALFVYYFATESSKRKRMAGTAPRGVHHGSQRLALQLHWVGKRYRAPGWCLDADQDHPEREGEITPTQQQQVIDVLNKRLNSLGTSEVILAPQGEDGIFLQMPGVGQEKLKEIEEILEQVAKLEFSILHPQSNMLAAQVAAGGQVVPGYIALLTNLTRSTMAAKGPSPVMVSSRSSATWKVKT